MASRDPALLAKLDQQVAALDTSVRRHTARIGVLIEEHGKEAAVEAFAGWLLNQPPEAVAALATGALARLALTAGRATELTEKPVRGQGETR
jgi:hypothetical protein